MEDTLTLDQVRLLFYEQLLFSVGPFLGALLSGALVALGAMCMLLLFSERQGRTRQRRIAQVYVVLVVTIVIGYQVETFILTNALAFRPFYELFSNLRHVLDVTDSLLPVVVISLTDGLLVWRCFMVQRTLGPNSSKLQAIFWIIPMCLWSTIVAAGFASVGLFSAQRECRTLSRCSFSLEIAETAVIIGNLTLNLFATSYIVIRLFLHRRILIYVYGRQHPTSQLISIISILLESSAINVPVAIVTVVQVYTPVIQTDFLPLCIACQAFTSILIIHQVAIGRAVRWTRHWNGQDDSKEVDEERATINSTTLSSVETMQSSRSP